MRALFRKEYPWWDEFKDKVEDWHDSTLQEADFG
jgi:hypothetical protein